MAGSGGCVASDKMLNLVVLVPALVLSGFILPKLLVLVAVISVLMIKYRRALYILIATLPRDLGFARKLISVLLQSRRYKRDNATVVSLFNSRALQHPDKTCFLFEDRIWTNRDVNEYSNRVANVFHNAGFRHGDIVALFMDNRPEYVCIWLGLAKLGVITALINNNLRLQPLLHSLQVAKPKGIIYCEPTASAFQEISGSLDSSINKYHLEPLTGDAAKDTSVTSLSPLLDSASTSSPKTDIQPCFNDKLLYIYTSGTTGLPKAAIIPHSRYLLLTTAALCVLGFRTDDVMYNPLPLYHTAGGILGIGPALVGGIPVAMKKKFSASAYWKDCIKYNCTVGQYIGEICRYILAVPPMPADRQHRVRLMLGNGMRSAIWSEFVHRFNVAHIAELYGATEGNANIVNCDNKVGAVGFLPRWVPWSIGRMGLIRVDPDTGAPIREPNGLCSKCDVDEPGMFVGVISSRDVTREYHGYVDKEASKRKIINDVFAKGDQAFLSGDILVMDEFGYLFFKDRTGDTFRWKGENVATAEVEAVISSNDVLGLRDAAVYGVEVPGQEGRAGMVAIADPDRTLDLGVLAAGVDRGLAPYARPIFVRVVNHLDLTATYKIRKVDIQKQGFDPEVVKDKLYVRQGATYVPLTDDLYRGIKEGRVRV